jgi:hypothetical protein
LSSDSIETEFRVKAVGGLPAEYVPAEQIHDRHQVVEAFPQPDADDVGRPILVYAPDRFVIHQAGKLHLRLPWVTQSLLGRLMKNWRHGFSLFCSTSSSSMSHRRP